MQIEQLYRDYGVIAFTEGQKHTRPGWINVACPFCTGNPGYHLGFHMDDEYFVCWRCGGHSQKHTFSKLLKVPYQQVSAVLRRYSLRTKSNTQTAKTIQIMPFKLPKPMLDTLPIQYKAYLKKRNFDSDKIQRLWDIRASGPYSILKTTDKKLNYKHRVIIPIYWDGEIVNFQGRDITDTSDWKYMACPEAVEKINIKKTLYGMQDEWEELSFGIGVEGALDVWRLGSHGVGLYGIKYTIEQVRLIKKYFKRFYVMFDPEDAQAQQQAKKLVGDLRFRGVEAYLILPFTDRDPADLTDKEARRLIRDLKSNNILSYME